MASPAGAAPNADPARPSGVPATAVWDPSQFGGQGGWVGSANSANPNQKAVYSADGAHTFVTDASGGGTLVAAGSPAALATVGAPTVGQTLAHAASKVKSTISSALNGPPTTNLQAVGTRAVGDAGGFRGLNVAGNEANLGESLQDTISGKNPSAADAELQQETAKNAGAQLGFASGLGGLNAALARRTAAENIGRINQGAVGQGVQLRAKEITDAQSKYGALLGQEHGQQLSEEQLAEQAYRDQLAAQSANRGQNIQIAGAGASGGGSLIAPGLNGAAGDAGGRGALTFTPPSGEDDIAKLE